MTTTTSFPGLTRIGEPIIGTLGLATIEELRSFFQEERYDREALEANIEHARSGRWFAEECETIDPADIDAANDILWLAIEMHGTTPTEAEPAQPLATITARSFGLNGWTTAIARTWPEETRHCGRCSKASCTLSGNACLILVKGYVDERDAPEYRRLAQ